MTTDQKGTTQMTKTSNLPAFAYHTTLPDGFVRTIKAATRRYTHSVVVQYGDLPDGYNPETHPAAGAWAVISDHSTEALAAKAAAKVAKDRVIYSGAPITTADGVQHRSFTDVRVVPMDNLRPEDMPEPTPAPEPQVCWCGRPVVTRPNGNLVHADQSPDARDDHGASLERPQAEVPTALDPCPNCGSVRLESVALHDTTRYLVCQACGWHEPEADAQLTADPAEIGRAIAQATQLPPSVAEAAKATRARMEAEQGPEPEAGVDYPADVPARALSDAKGQIVALQDALDRVTKDRDHCIRALSDSAADHSRQAQALMAEVAEVKAASRAALERIAGMSYNAKGAHVSVARQALEGTLDARPDAEDVARQANLLDEYRADAAAKQDAIEDLQRQLENAKEAEGVAWFQVEQVEQRRRAGSDLMDMRDQTIEDLRRRLLDTQAVAIDLGYSLLRTSHAPANLARQGIEAKLGEVGLRLTTQHGVPDEYADPAANPYPTDEPDDEPEVDEYDPGPEVDDEGGMSEFRTPAEEDRSL